MDQLNTPSAVTTAATDDTREIVQLSTLEVNFPDNFPADVKAIFTKAVETVSEATAKLIAAHADRSAAEQGVFDVTRPTGEALAAFQSSRAAFADALKGYFLTASSAIGTLLDAKPVDMVRAYNNQVQAEATWLATELAITAVKSGTGQALAVIEASKAPEVLAIRAKAVDVESVQTAYEKIGDVIAASAFKMRRKLIQELAALTL